MPHLTATEARVIGAKTIATGPQIIATGAYREVVTTALPELKELVKASTGKSVRRIDRFIQLALIGVGRCVGDAILPADTAVYMASPHGDLEVTQNIIADLFREGLAPKPVTFINSVSNAACFYIAHSFALEGPSNFVCNRYFAFESALQLALSDFAAGRIRNALVGVVDVITEPLQSHRMRAGVEADTPLLETSHWVWLGNSDAGGGGRVIAARHCSDRVALKQWFERLGVSPQTTQFRAGQFLAGSDAQWICDELGLTIVAGDAAGGVCNSISAAAIEEFQRRFSGEEKYQLHVNADSLGRYSAFVVAAG